MAREKAFYVQGRRQKIRLGVLFFLVLTLPITMIYFSPVLTLNAASVGIASFSLFFWTAWIVLSLLLGRAMCGWICPLVHFKR
jgi:ferredoxin-type protein NapH